MNKRTKIITKKVLSPGDGGPDTPAQVRVHKLIELQRATQLMEIAFAIRKKEAFDSYRSQARGLLDSLEEWI